MEETHNALSTRACDVRVCDRNGKGSAGLDVDPLVEVPLSVKAQEKPVSCDGIARAASFAALADSNVRKITCSAFTCLMIQLLLSSK